MERLGFWGIIKLTTHILLRNLQHFLCITLLLALPNALSFIVYSPFGKVLQNFGALVSLSYKLISGALDPSNLTPSEEALIANLQQHAPAPFLLLLVSILSITIFLVCTILVTFSVCRACLNKSMDLKGSLRGVRRSAKNLYLTWRMKMGVVFVLGMLAMLEMVIIAAGLSAVKVSVAIPITIIAIGVAGGVLFLGVVFSLAYTVAILEEKKGWEAISKSAHLIKGSRWIVVGLNGLHGVVTMGTLCLIAYSEEGSVVWRWVAGGASVGLSAFIALSSMVSTVVVYMSCKSAKGEPLETLLAASSEFGPKYLDLETAASLLPHNHPHDDPQIFK